MSENTFEPALLILLVGGLVVVSILTKALFERIRIPSLLGYLCIGFLIRVADTHWKFLSETGESVFDFLAEVGIVVLLFRIGLETNLGSLVKQLRSASIIWIGNVVGSGALGYVTAHYLLGLEPIPSAVIGTAMTATSVGIPVRVWKDEDKLDTTAGERFLDVAELDDISGVVLMAFLFALLPAIRGSGSEPLGSIILKNTLRFVLTAAAFGGFCFLFSRYLEERLTRFAKQIEPAPSPMLVVTGTGFVIAGLADFLGFSVAIGAFFAGLVFSRDPGKVRIDASFSSVYELFCPFFFIGIGLQMAPDSLGGATGMGLAFLGAAVLGKIIGTIGPALFCAGVAQAVILAVSMVPRAEITLVIMNKGLQLGKDVVSRQVFSAMVKVSAATCAVAPVILQKLLRKTGSSETET